MTDYVPPFVASRRRVLQAGAGLVGGALLPAGLARSRIGADQPPIGNYPAGVSGSSVFIGICLPRTGTYAVPGEDELKGFELAIEHLNTGDPLIRKISPHTTKGVLGKQVMHGVADSEAKPNVAVQAQSRFITENKAMMIAGSVSVGRGGGAEQARAAREGDLPAGHQRLQRHHRQGLRALLVPPVLLCADGGGGDHAGDGQAARQEQEDRVPDAGLHLWPHGAAVDAGRAWRRTAGRWRPTRSARWARRTTAPIC